MGQKLIITESERNNILSLYEQTPSFDSLLVGKTLNLYNDPSNSTLLKRFDVTNANKPGYQTGVPFFSEIGPTFKILKPKYTDLSMILLESVVSDRELYDFVKENFVITLVLSCKYNPDLIDGKAKLNIRFSPEGASKAILNKWIFFEKNQEFTIECYPSRDFINLLNKNFNFCTKPQADFGSKNNTQQTKSIS